MERLQHTTSNTNSVSASNTASQSMGADRSGHDDSTHKGSADKKQPYISNQPDADGNIHYSDDDNAMWQALLERQADQIPNRACSAYIDGLTKLNLPTTHIPQLSDIDDVLQATTGWKTAAVPA